MPFTDGKRGRNAWRRSLTAVVLVAVAFGLSNAFRPWSGNAAWIVACSALFLVSCGITDWLTEKRAGQVMKRLRFITDQLPSSVSYFDTERRYRFVNESFEQWFGIKREKIIGHTREELITDHASYEEMIPHEKRALSGEAVNFQLKLQKSDGTFSYLDLNLRPDLDDQGVVRGVLSVAHDVTERELALKQAQVAIKTRDEFMSIVSHELRTPITGMMLHTQLMQKQLKREDPGVFQPEAIAKFIERADRGLDRMAHLVEDMLDISRIQGGKLSLSREADNLVAVVSETLGRFAAQLDEAGIAIGFDAPLPVTVPLDKFRMEQVVTNLITNAIRYAPNAPVEVRIREQDGKAVIVFADGGPGILEVNRERVFQRFERLVSPNEISGLGMGLFIVKEIVEAHGGTIAVTGPTTRGAQFTIMLPGEGGNA